MGWLPASRFSPQPPFFTNGEYYICIFICFEVKAIHLEILSDLSSEGFIAAFRGFVVSRGKHSNIHFDNGSNFVGIHSELTELANLFNLLNLK